MQNFLCVTLIFLAMVANADLQPITIGLLPGGNPEAIKRDSFTLAEKLQNKLGRPVQIFISKNYSSMTDALKSKKVDFAIMSSMIYVVSEKETNIKVLLKKTWNGPFYYSALVVGAKSRIKKVKDLQNKKIVFVDEKSSSGFLYPQVFLRKSGITEVNFKTSQFSGNHAASVEMLENGTADVIAVFADDEKAKTGAWTRFQKQKKFQTRVLWVSEPIPNDPIVVRQEYYDQNPKLTHEFMYSLIEIQNESGTLFTEILGSSELMPATSKQYDPVRDMVRVLQGHLKL